MNMYHIWFNVSVRLVGVFQSFGCRYLKLYFDVVHDAGARFPDLALGTYMCKFERIANF